MSFATTAAVIGSAAAAKMAFDPKTGKQTTTQQIDPAQQAMYDDLYGRAKGIASQPFVPYTGSRVAGFNPDQLRQFEATRGRFETGMQYDPITGLQGLAQQGAPTIGPITGYQGATIGGVQGPQAAQIGGIQAPQFQSLLSQDIGAYQSPYQQQVIDQSMADIQRQADIQRGFSQDRAIGAGAFGGSRSALLEGESQRPFIEQMARTSAGLRESGFQQAQQAAQSDIARQQQLGVFGAEQQQQRALEQARLGQQAGLTGFEAQQQRAMRQAELGQQAGLAGQDIQARMAMFAPELELQARAQQAGLLGGLSAEQQRRMGGLGQIGAQQQGLQQMGLGVPYEEFQRALAYGPQQLGLLAQGVSAQPQNISKTTGYQPSSLEGITGAINMLNQPYMKEGFQNIFGGQSQAPAAPIPAQQYNLGSGFKDYWTPGS